MSSLAIAKVLVLLYLQRRMFTWLAVPASTQDALQDVAPTQLPAPLLLTPALLVTPALLLLLLLVLLCSAASGGRVLGSCGQPCWVR